MLVKQRMKKKKKSLNKTMISGLLFDANKLLNGDSAINRAGDHLFFIGLMNQCVNNEDLEKRKKVL
jgi:hypothetical protein